MIRRSINLLIIFLFLKSGCLLGVDCKQHHFYRDIQVFYNVSEIIFIGKIIAKHERLYEFEVYETFKGESKENIMIEFEPSMLKPVKGQVWLVYAIFKNNKYFVHECSISRSFDHPVLHFYKLPLIEIPFDSVAEKKFQSEYKILKEKALEDLHFEIRELRERKNNNELNSINSRVYTIIRIQYITIATIIVLIILSFFLLYRK